jgi:hypothetical protein
VSNTGFVFAYAIGLIFLVGGLIFLLAPTEPLEDYRLLFGIPYAGLGLLMVLGLHAGRRRKRAQEARERELLGPDAGLGHDPEGR